MMAVTWYPVMIGVVLFGFGLELTHGAHGDAICGGESSDLEPEQVLQEAISTCFPKAPLMPIGFDICSEGYINCNAFREVYQVIPSCRYCSRSDVSEKACFYAQLNATRCSVNDFTSSFHCVKQNGGLCNQCDVQYTTGGTRQGTTAGTGPQTTTTVASSDNSHSSGSISGTDAYRGRKCTRCEPCHCEQQEDESSASGVSVEAAVGLFFLGLILGTVVTIVICVCVPNLHSKSCILRGKVREKISRRSFHEQKSTSQQHLDQAATNASIPMAVGTQGPPSVPIPSAPPGTGSFQAGYHTLDLNTDARDSHMYTGLQPNANIYNEPMGEGATYEEPDSQPMRGKNTVTSPVYQELPDNIIQNTAFSDKHNKPLNKNDTNVDRNNDGATGSSEDQRPQSGHHYFVLEEQGQQQLGNVTQTTDAPYHDYFVLEKEQS